MMFLASNGFRCVAHDRRGHGRSSQPWLGNDMDTYADDLATLVNALDLTGVVHVGHSTGGGEVARYIGRHGTDRVTKTVNAERNVATGNPYKELAVDLMERGVQIELCGATAKVHKWGNIDLLAGVKINTDAMARTTQLVQEGFVKITE